MNRLTVLNITTWENMLSYAEHYYGMLYFFTEKVVKDNELSFETLEYHDPSAIREADDSRCKQIEIVRKLSRKEYAEYKRLEGRSRCEKTGWFPGFTTNKFYDIKIIEKYGLKAWRESNFGGNFISLLDNKNYEGQVKI